MCGVVWCGVVKKCQHNNRQISNISTKYVAGTAATAPYVHMYVKRVALLFYFFVFVIYMSGLLS